jgi:HSP20 family molecular chaperone IbpA
LQELNKNYGDQFTKNRDLQRQSISQQERTFLSNLSKIDNANKEALSVQDRIFNRQLSQMKAENRIKLDDFKEKESDPFYKLADRNSEMWETETHYKVRTYIPEYEKKNVKVRVKDDRVMISGNRRFDDKVQDPEKKISTSNFQTFHEEYKFESPVSVRGIEEERMGDFVTYSIPKLAYLKNKV